MIHRNWRGGIHDPTIAKEQIAERFSLEDLLGEVREQVSLGGIVSHEGEMATKGQIAANRKNAKRSTGPRTDGGKARSKMNATKHGLLGQFNLIEGENEQEFFKFAEQTIAALKPEGAVEHYFVDRWIKDAWLLSRLDNVESALLANQESLHELSTNDVLSIIKYLTSETGRRIDELPELLKYLKVNTQATAQNRRDAGSTRDAQSARVVQALREDVELGSLELVLTTHLTDRLGKTKSANGKGHSPKPLAQTDLADGEQAALSTQAAVNMIACSFARNRGPLDLALRYRTKIGRSRDNALHELQRLQAARYGREVTPPPVLDVNVNFTDGQEDSD